MKKRLLVFLVLILFQGLTPAISWVDVTTPNNRRAYLDKDSITEFSGYYFYNIKFQNPGESDFVVMTMQSSKSSPLSARLKAYTVQEYDSLAGDYSNITKNMKSSLEPVTYQSVVNTCYREVKRIKEAAYSDLIIINSEEDTVE